MAKPRVEIELALSPTAAVTNAKAIVARLHKLLLAAGNTLTPGTFHFGEKSEDVVAVRLCEPDFGVRDDDEDEDEDRKEARVFSYSQVDPSWLVYQCNTESPSVMTISGVGGDGEGEGGSGGSGSGADSPAYTQLSLPNLETEGLWESLVVEESTKRNLLSFSASSLLFGQRGVDSQLVAANKVVLLYGPPGTGKTTLCKALAHKLAVRVGGLYPQALLLEINAHSLFSRYFSESGKQVTKLFSFISDVVDAEDAYVFLLIDEVESLASARSAAIKGNEPGDAVRVVNAVLTALDSLRSRPNVMLLCTSNVTEALDVAFVDRADIKLYLGNPPMKARHAIMAQSLAELVRCGLAYTSDSDDGDDHATAAPSPSPSPSPFRCGDAEASTRLLDKIEAALRSLGASAPPPSSSSVAVAGDGDSGAAAMPPPSSSDSAAAAAPLLLVSSALGKALVKEAITVFEGGHGNGSGSGTVVAVVASAVIPGLRYSLCAPQPGHRHSSQPLATAVGSAKGATGAAGGVADDLLSASDFASVLLAAAARAADNFSGRSLRKLPLQAHARFIRSGTGLSSSSSTTTRVAEDGGGKTTAAASKHRQPSRVPGSVHVIAMAQAFARFAVWERKNREAEKARGSCLGASLGPSALAAPSSTASSKGEATLEL